MASCACTIFSTSRYAAPFVHPSAQSTPQEHLILVTELLRANLYEFQKYNRKQPGQEPYFTLPRMQRIAIQVPAG